MFGSSEVFITFAETKAIDLLFFIRFLMSASRLNIRIPEEYRARLEERARVAGYVSGCALARCVLVQFLRYQAGERSFGTTEWIEELLYGDADRNDATQRRNINERR